MFQVTSLYVCPVCPSRVRVLVILTEHDSSGTFTVPLSSVTRVTIVIGLVERRQM